MARLPQELEQWLRLIADNTASGSAFDDTDLIAAMQDVELSVDENKAKVVLNTAALGILDAALGMEIIGSGVVRTITIAGSGGSIGLDIEDVGSGVVQYDENDAGTVESTIDAWLVTHAANILTNQGITATKGSAFTILLTGSAGSGAWNFSDGSVTMTATAGFASVIGINADVLAALASLETQVDLTTTAVDLTTTAVDTNKTAVDLVKTAVDENKAKVILNTTAVDSVKTAVDQNKTQVDLVTGAVNTNKTAVDLVKTAVDENKAKVILGTTAVDGVKTAVDQNKTQVDLVTTAVNTNKTAVDLVTAAIDQLRSQSFGGAGFEVAGGVTTETLTITGGSGTLGIDITSGSAPTVAYDEAWNTSVEVTIDNWLTTNAANMLVAHGITATKASASTILLTGSVPAGIWVFADGGSGMAASSGGQSTAMNTITSDCSVIEVVADAVFDVVTTVGFGDVLPFGHAATAGTKIVGNFTNIKLVSGVALCYVI